MPALGFDDAQMSYRRGYQHGAAEVFHAVERFLDPAAREGLRSWIEEDLYGWRFHERLGTPPTWRLRILTARKSD